MSFKKKINSKEAVIGVIGLGYVGLPLALEFALKDFKVIGFDTDESKIPKLKGGKTYIRHIDEKKIKTAIKSKKFIPTCNFELLKEVDAVIICVPTPLDKNNEPDLSYVINTTNVISKYLKKNMLIVLESTTYPGTTEEVVLSILKQAKTNLKVGKDYYLAFSPEREDPNNLLYTTSTIPKIVGGLTAECLKNALELYNQIVVKTIPVSSVKVAEAAKLLENIYRSVNIALVNELKMIFDKMGIDIWEVIEAAKTKPFGFNPFYPGPGLGGHCIPIDPFYLAHKAKEYGASTKFIELAGEINTLQPYYVFENAVKELNKKGKAVSGARVLILGAAYKKNVDDLRESPALKLIEIFTESKAKAEYYDPYVPKLPKTRKHNFNMTSVKLTPSKIKSYDLVVLVTDHDVFDYKMISKNAKLILDTRNAFRLRGIKGKNIIKS